MYKKRRFKKKPFIIIGASIILLIILMVSINLIIKNINYRKTYEYKFLNIGYTQEEFNIINSLNNDNKNYLLTLDYNKNIVNIINEKYFLKKNLKKYIDYLNTSNKSIKDVISIINVNADNEFYTNTKKTDISKGHLMLTNKFYYLDNTYNSDNMTSISKTYSYGENQKLTSETFNAFLNMYKKAKEEGLTLIINSSFRSYEEQIEVYNDLKDYNGEEYADKIAARPGHSEHQTGMAIDIQTYGSTSSTFEEFDEFKWLKDNAHKYGFILRYPKDKEYITGYSYESWHYRYVGVEVATYIYENNITFDEYYAYFIEK